LEEPAGWQLGMPGLIVPSLQVGSIELYLYLYLIIIIIIIIIITLKQE
jgi:hypothetical protein